MFRTAKPVRLKRRLRFVDIFSSIGGLTNGVWHGLHHLGYDLLPLLAVDLDGRALEVYRENFHPLRISRDSVHRLVRYSVHRTLSGWRFHSIPTADGALGSLKNSVDLLVAGPPCQGHSSLNNHTRSNDPRNHLYVTAVAAGIAVGARCILVENVPGVVRDSLGVLDIARDLLESSGYNTDAGVIRGEDIGWVQRRKRHFLVACKGPIEPLKTILREYAAPPMAAAAFLQQCPNREELSVLNTVPEYGPETMARFRFFEENPGLFDLPCEYRPECHRNGTTYKAVYGRMKPQEPIPTITSGFLTPGRGRFIHPVETRTLTPGEAAYAQGLPSWFTFKIEPEPNRSELSKWIGDAVPLPLGFVAIQAFRRVLSQSS